VLRCCRPTAAATAGFRPASRHGPTVCPPAQSRRERRVRVGCHLVFWLASFAIIERQEPLGRCVRDDGCTARAYRREVLPDFPCSHGAVQKVHVFTGVNPYRDLQRWVSTSYSCLSIALESSMNWASARLTARRWPDGSVKRGMGRVRIQKRPIWGFFPLTGDRIGPFRRVCETRRERNRKSPAPPTHIR
jgi:hypothetical protein